MASLKDVADAAGVSIATVSHVLNGTRFVSPALTLQVRTAMSHLNYTPNLLARSLRIQRSHTLGFITADVTNPFYPSVAKGATVAATQRGYNLMLVDSEENPGIEAEATGLLLQKKVDGLMYTSISLDSDIPKWLATDGTPFVCINRRAISGTGLYVGIENKCGMVAAVDHLAEMGHQRIAFIAGNPISSAAQARRDGFLEGMERNGLCIDPQLMCEGDYRLEGGCKAAEHLAGLKDPPTALVAANDVMAFGAWQCFRQLGLSVPEDISLVGFDDIALSSMAPIGLTTVRCPMYEMGLKAATMLIDAIEGKPIQDACIELPVELVIRDTTAAPRRDRRVLLFVS
jgi:DNA-binding LacI/PurR family transcriptional regulator